ncbi:Crp/Fnr family transcriptional regulator [Marinobacter salicampi]|uniref:Crp/Fnr family transcriptional regulator n=1 Tax=Marinobacter salicampi TaxID=435907 RepID=UPI0014098914|nr:Crp/Fnr family transcriptional regulator [Marinobacter salicampi]
MSDYRYASAPCLLADGAPDIIQPVPPTDSLALSNSLSRVFGIRRDDRESTPDSRFITELAGLFRKAVVEPEIVLERHQRPWANVYLIQYGVVRLFREAVSGKVAIHHFFSEGDMVWPVFGRTRTTRNTLCLTSVTHCKVWVAGFSAFRAAIISHGEERWPRFALSLTEELAELTSMREFRKQTLQAKDRYRLMLQEYPELVQRVPDNQLAAWLGVAPATFSRLKHSDG